MIGAFIAKEEELQFVAQSVQKHFMPNVRQKLDVYFQNLISNVLARIGYVLIVKILLFVLYALN